MRRKLTLRRRPGAARLRFFRPRAEELEPRNLMAGPIYVTNTNDSGDGSLRQAILDANALGGTNVIDFDIGSGQQIIYVGSSTDGQPLPAITSPVIIDGYTEPGASPNTLTQGTNALPLIELNGYEVNGYGVGGGPGLEVDAGGSGSIIRGLMIGGFSGGAAVLLDGNDTLLTGDYLGLDLSGSGELGNVYGVEVNGSDDTIGGTSPADRNFISNNEAGGVNISDPSASGNVLLNNYIGLNVDGTNLGNGGDGVDVYGPNNVIGGNQSGDGNVISNNEGAGVAIYGPGSGATNNSVLGNYIGVDPTGTVAMGNGGDGVDISAAGNFIGGAQPGDGNVISGNSGSGIAFFDETASPDDNTVQGNFIGTDATGTFAVGNDYDGVDISGTGNIIGGPSTGEGNLISGNLGNGIDVGDGDNPSSDEQVLGNLIGSDITGTLALGNAGAGVYIFGPNNFIGGTTAGDGNVIVANGDGIVIDGEMATNNAVQGNWIGTNQSGQSELGNSGDGVEVLDDGADDNLIGGSAAGAGNVIVNNTQAGIAAIDNTVGNSFRGNSIYNNGALGIDLGDDGVTPNAPPDSRSGPNNFQDYPTLSSATSGSSTRVTGSLVGEPNATYVVDFYANTTLDPSGFGQGERYLGSAVVTTDAAGNASIDVTLSSATQTGEFVTSTATDSSGNTSEFSQGVQTVAPPAAPLVLGITQDTGVPGDGITNDRTLLIYGTAVAGDTVEVYQDGTSLGTVTASASGNWTFDNTAVSLPDGSYDFTAVTIDSVGNSSVVSSPFHVVVDTTAPAAPLVLGITQDTGVPGDGITNDRTLLIYGTAVAGDTVEVYQDGTSLGTVTASASGNWTFDNTAVSLPDGSYDFTAVTIDSVGNSSVVSSPFHVVVDTTAPAAPLVLGITQDTGVPGDGITNDRTLLIYGTAVAGDTVEVYQDGTSLGTVTASASGNWTFDNTAVSLPDGSYDFTAVTIDSVGNSSVVSSPFHVVVDTTAPAAPLVLGITQDTGVPGDGITNDRTLLIYGTAVAGDTVEVYQDGTSLGTVTASASGNWTFDNTAVSLPDGSYDFTAVTIDSVGNSSVVSSPFHVVVDTTAPAAPLVLGITQDTGVPGDGITNDRTLLIYGTAVAGDTVEVYQDGTSLGTVTASASGNWTFDNTAVSLPDGSYDFTAVTIDSVGNSSVVSSPFHVVVDTTAPAAPLVLGITQDTGVPGDGITNDRTLLIYGTAVAGDTVEVYQDGTSLGTVTASASGNWTFDNTAVSLPDGSYDFTAVTIDSVGNSSVVSSPFHVVVDTTAPAAPLVLGITQDTGVPGDGITNDRTLLIYGTAVAGDTVEVYQDGTSLGTVTASASGNWTFDNTAVSLPDGSYDFTAVTIDSVGNSSVVSSPFHVVVDTTAPAAPLVLGITQDTGVPGDGITNDRTLLIYGTAVAGDTVEVYQDGTSLGTVTASASGNWTFDNTAVSLPDGSYDFTAVTIDSVGNSSVVSSPFHVVVDTTAPAAPLVLDINNDIGHSGADIVSDGILTIFGTAEPDSTVTVYRDGTLLGTVTATSGGAWAFNTSGTALPPGLYELSAIATDLAGNSSVPSVSLGVILVQTGSTDSIILTPVTVVTILPVKPGSGSSGTSTYAGTSTSAYMPTQEGGALSKPPAELKPGGSGPPAPAPENVVPLLASVLAQADEAQATLAGERSVPLILTPGVDGLGKSAAAFAQGAGESSELLLFGAGKPLGLNNTVPEGDEGPAIVNKLFAALGIADPLSDSHAVGSKLLPAATEVVNAETQPELQSPVATPEGGPRGMRALQAVVVTALVALGALATAVRWRANKGESV